MTTLWNTTGSELVKALASERRTGGAVTSGNALTLVVVVDEQHVADAEQAAAVAASHNPCRVLIVVRRELDVPQPRLDAEILVGGRLGPGEAIVMRMYGRLALHAESVTLPLLAPDAPVVTWWHGAPPKHIANDPLGVFSDRRITDCGWIEDGKSGLLQRARDFAAGDTDLAWTRTTPWRSAIASTFDTVTATATRVSVTGAPQSPALMLLAGWLSSRLDLKATIKSASHDLNQSGISAVDIELGSDESIRFAREDSSVIISRTGQQEQRATVVDRNLGELLTEELRRLDADEIYADALSVATGVEDLRDRPSDRTHVWVDPVESTS